jgi:hypothetical protein
MSGVFNESGRNFFAGTCKHYTDLFVIGNVPILSQAPTKSVLNPKKKLKSSEDTKSS